MFAIYLLLPTKEQTHIPDLNTPHSFTSEQGILQAERDFEKIIALKEIAEQLKDLNKLCHKKPNLTDKAIGAIEIELSGLIKLIQSLNVPISLDELNSKSTCEKIEVLNNALLKLNLF